MTGATGVPCCWSEDRHDWLYRPGAARYSPVIAPSHERVGPDVVLDMPGGCASRWSPRRHRDDRFARYPYFTVPLLLSAVSSDPTP